MNARSTTRLTASLVLATGLITAPAIPVAAAVPPPVSAVAAKQKHKLPDRCWPSYKHDLQRLRRRMNYQLPHHDSRHASVDNLLDNMVDVLVSGAHDVLAQMAAGVANTSPRS